MYKAKISFGFFVVVSILVLAGIIFNNQQLIAVFKPFIVISLALLYKFSIRTINYVYLCALLFSLLGDIFLLYNEEEMFLFGLISFLLAHFFFIKIIMICIYKSTIKNILMAVFPFLSIYFILIFILEPFLKEMLFPVIFYGLIISTFGTVALLNFLNIRSKQAFLMLIGAVLFICSDSVLAINKFYVSTLFFEITIMITYILAQYFIYKSMILKAP